MAQKVKNLPAIQEIWVQSLGWEDPLKKGMATHYSVLAWRISRTLWSMGLQSWTRLWDFDFHIPASMLANFKMIPTWERMALV